MGAPPAFSLYMNQIEEWEILAESDEHSDFSENDYEVIEAPVVLEVPHFFINHRFHVPTFADIAKSNPVHQHTSYAWTPIRKRKHKKARRKYDPSKPKNAKNSRNKKR